MVANYYYQSAFKASCDDGFSRTILYKLIDVEIDALGEYSLLCFCCVVVGAGLNFCADRVRFA
ncbi:hypothetical protein D3C81_2006810 [compost metagenome]